MRPKSEIRGTAEQVVKGIRRATRKHHATEEKIRIELLEGLPGEFRLADDFVCSHLAPEVAFSLMVGNQRASSISWIPARLATTKRRRRHCRCGNTACKER
jgi:transposase